MMSKQSHRQRRRDRHLRGHADTNDSDYGVQAGWCHELVDLEDAKQQTHDALIANMGDRRVGGVSWSITTGDEAFARLHGLFESGTPAHADGYRRIRGLLREQGGYLVIAFAEGIKR